MNKPSKLPKDRCSERINIPGVWFGTKQCSRKVKVIREGKGYCNIHDPERIKQKRMEDQKLYEESLDKRQKEFERTKLEKQYCKNLTNEQLKQAIAKAEGINE
jgi:hypothetical protein